MRREARAGTVALRRINRSVGSSLCPTSAKLIAVAKLNEDDQHGSRPMAARRAARPHAGGAPVAFATYAGRPCRRSSPPVRRSPGILRTTLPNRRIPRPCLNVGGEVYNLEFV